MTPDILDTMVAAAIDAGRQINEIYDAGFAASEKADGSPVTVADQRSEEIIIAALAPFGLPVLGEESVDAGHIPDLGDRFFVVDPLDGTKEFISGNGEFTVNIALVEGTVPVAGVVLAPARALLYAGDGRGAWTAAIGEDGAGPRRPIRVTPEGPLLVVASRSHGHAALAVLKDELRITGDVSVGSSLKFGLLADGQARLYPRLTPTCEWDTAAGQAVLEAAGGAIVTIEGAPMRYGRREAAFLNPMFVAASDRALALRCASLMRQLI